jgi:hypothetical protein
VGEVLAGWRPADATLAPKILVDPRSPARVPPASPPARRTA